ncbi:hypothetical protein ACFFV7_44195 [Nonomuraea spiralis]|uniref:Uncharacterized protein n=1 Tax=Nonomuraea spiralis TaxID=46182 RepID=A0ABV5IUK9_9ACTN|nr:hypothetical protein [Nonomuraea spiralis]GGS90213.1 hypothetical protein GCM10010176_037490 [Nonomuraea spiralis]
MKNRSRSGSRKSSRRGSQSESDSMDAEIANLLSGLIEIDPDAPIITKTKQRTSITLSEVSPSPPVEADSESRPKRVALAARLVEALAKRDPKIDLRLIEKDDRASRATEDDFLGAFLIDNEWTRLRTPLNEAAELMYTHPLQRHTVLDGLTRFVTMDIDKDYPALLKDLAEQGALKGKEAIKRVLAGKPEELQALPLEAKRDLVRDIVAAAATADDNDYYTALAALYPHIELDPDFAQRDAAIRRRVENRIRDALGPDIRRWISLENKDRVVLLEKALKIHADEYGMGDRIPKITLSNTNEPGVKSCGMFDRIENEIKINSEWQRKWDDLDEALDTVIHENTHNYQNWLATKLADGSIQPDDPDYLQASLFALNDGYGYVQKQVPHETYKSQPMERHAWLAGGDIRNLWLTEAQAEVQVAVNELKQAKLHERYPTFERLEEAATSKNTTTIFSLIEGARKYIVDTKRDDEDTAVRERYVERLRNLQAHPALKYDVAAISLLITKIRTQDIATTDIQQEFEQFQQKADRDRT